MRVAKPIITALIIVVLSVAGALLMVQFDSGGRVWLKFVLYTIFFVNIFGLAQSSSMKVTFPGFHSY